MYNIYKYLIRLKKINKKGIDDKKSDSYLGYLFLKNKKSDFSPCSLISHIVLTLTTLRLLCDRR